jgi:hypothetical protein
MNQVPGDSNLYTITETVSIAHMLNWRTPLKNLEGIKMMFVYAFFSVNFCSCF